MASFFAEATTPTDYFVAVSEGVIPNTTSVHKMGLNPDVDNGALPQTVWSGRIAYPWSTTAETWYLSSSSAADTAVEVTLLGLTGAYAEVAHVRTLTGQTPIALTGTLLRNNSLYVSGATEAVGDIYLSRSNTVTNGVPNTATDIRGKILIGQGAGLQAFYTVPAGWTGYLLHVMLQTSAANTEMMLRTRTPDASWRTRSYSRIGSASSVEVDWNAPLVLEEKTDIEVRIPVSVNNNQVVTSHFDILLKRA